MLMNIMLVLVLVGVAGTTWMIVDEWNKAEQQAHDDLRRIYRNRLKR